MSAGASERRLSLERRKNSQRQNAEKGTQIRVRFKREKRASRLKCLSFDLGDDRRSSLGGGDVRLAIFITSVSGSESLTSFTNRFVHFSRLPGFRMVFDAAETNGRFGHI